MRTGYPPAQSTNMPDGNAQDSRRYKESYTRRRIYHDMNFLDNDNLPPHVENAEFLVTNRTWSKRTGLGRSNSSVEPPPPCSLSFSQHRVSWGPTHDVTTIQLARVHNSHPPDVAGELCLAVHDDITFVEDRPTLGSTEVILQERIIIVSPGMRQGSHSCGSDQPKPQVGYVEVTWRDTKRYLPHCYS